MTTTRYIVVPAPGHYGDRARVISAHDSLAAAKRACGGSSAWCVRTGHTATADADGNPWIPRSEKGDVWFRVYEQGNPILYRPVGRVRS